MANNGKKLGLMNLVGLGVGSAIGTGIFIMLGYGIAYTGRSITLVCGVGCIFMLLAFWYAEAFGSLFVLKGGEYGARSMVFPPLLAGVSAWFQILSCFVLAGHSKAIVQFAARAWPAIGQHETLAAIIVLTLGFLCSIKGNNLLAKIQNLVVVALFAAIALFVFFGVPKVNPAVFFSNQGEPFFMDGGKGFISAIAIMSFACMGTSAAISLGPDTKNPKRTIPMAAFVTTLVVAAVYFIMAYVAAGILPYEQIAGQNISVTAEVIMPQWAYMFFIVGGGIFAIGSTMLSCIAVFVNPILSVSEDGWIPKAFTKTTKGGLPYVALLTLYIVSMIPLVTGLDIEGIVGNIMVPTMIMNAFINFYCLKLPKQFPAQWEKRGIRFPLWLWNTLSVFGGVFAVVVIYNTYINLDTKAKILCIIEVVLSFVASYITLKKGWVSKKQLNESRERAIREAISGEDA